MEIWRYKPIPDHVNARRVNSVWCSRTCIINVYRSSQNQCLLVPYECVHDTRNYLVSNYLHYIANEDVLELSKCHSIRNLVRVRDIVPLNQMATELSAIVDESGILMRAHFDSKTVKSPLKDEYKKIRCIASPCATLLFESRYRYLCSLPIKRLFRELPSWEMHQNEMFYRVVNQAIEWFDRRR